MGGVGPLEGLLPRLGHARHLRKAHRDGGVLVAGGLARVAVDRRGAGLHPVVDREVAAGAGGHQGAGRVDTAGAQRGDVGRRGPAVDQLAGQVDDGDGPGVGQLVGPRADAAAVPLALPEGQVGPGPAGQQHHVVAAALQVRGEAPAEGASAAGDDDPERPRARRAAGGEPVQACRVLGEATGQWAAGGDGEARGEGADDLDALLDQGASRLVVGVGESPRHPQGTARLRLFEHEMGAGHRLGHGEGGRGAPVHLPDDGGARHQEAGLALRDRAVEGHLGQRRVPLGPPGQVGQHPPDGLPVRCQHCP